MILTADEKNEMTCYEQRALEVRGFMIILMVTVSSRFAGRRRHEGHLATLVVWASRLDCESRHIVVALALG